LLAAAVASDDGDDVTAVDAAAAAGDLSPHESPGDVSDEFDANLQRKHGPINITTTTLSQRPAPTGKNNSVGSRISKWTSISNTGVFLVCFNIMAPIFLH